jgi:Flp pilus assembly secretin CpaC
LRSVEDQYHDLPVRPSARLRGLFVVNLLAMSASEPALAVSKDITVLIDQASLLRLERPASEIVVGNPSIGDVSVQSGKLLMITGKSFGETNIIVVDALPPLVVDTRNAFALNPEEMTK